MRRILPALPLLASASFAADIDREIPIAPGSTELRAGWDQGFGTGSYDNDGDRHDATGSPMTSTPMLQAKYGAMPGLEADATLLFELRNGDASGKGKSTSGLKRPELGVKYLERELGIGAFAALYIPIGSSDIEGDDPITTIEGGLLYGKRFDRVLVNASASYVFNTEAPNLRKQDLLDFYGKASYDLDGQLVPNLVAEYRWKFEAKVDGSAQSNSDGHLLLLRPGATWAANDRMRLEGSLPFTVLGRNDYSWWGLSLAGVWSFGG